MDVNEEEAQRVALETTIDELEREIQAWFNVTPTSFIFACRVARLINKIFPGNTALEEYPSTRYGWVSLGFYEQKTAKGGRKVLGNIFAMITACHDTKVLSVDSKSSDGTWHKKRLENKNVARELTSALREISALASKENNEN